MAAAMSLDLATTFVVVEPNLSALPVAVTETIFDELDRRFAGFKGRLLVATFEFDCDWSTWERHPAGDEIVCLMSGRATIVLDRDGTHEIVELEEPGAFVIVPKDTWHLARTSVPTRMLFVTPGEGTQNKPVGA